MVEEEQRGVCADRQPRHIFKGMCSRSEQKRWMGEGIIFSSIHEILPLLEEMVSDVDKFK